MGRIIWDWRQTQRRHTLGCYIKQHIFIGEIWPTPAVTPVSCEWCSGAVVGSQFTLEAMQ
jgi:hypothetical protein